MQNVLVLGNLTDKTKKDFCALPDYAFSFYTSREEIPEEVLKETEIFIGPAGPGEVARAPKLQWIQTFSAGVNGYDWLPPEIQLSNAYGAYGGSIAEHLLAVTLMAMKRLPDYLEGQKQQKWELLHDISRFEGSNIVVVGMGAIGSGYARRAHALGAECYGVRRTKHDAPDYVKALVTPDEMDALLPAADVVALCLPSTKDTKGMFDAKRLRLIRPGAILLNVGRGDAIVTDDLVALVREGHFKAVCLDTMDPEPLPKGHPLWSLPNVYLTPHISGGFRAGVNYESVMGVVLENLKRNLQGLPPVHVVDRARGY